MRRETHLNNWQRSYHACELKQPRGRTEAVGWRDSRSRLVAGEAGRGVSWDAPAEAWLSPIPTGKVCTWGAAVTQLQLISPGLFCGSLLLLG